MINSLKYKIFWFCTSGDHVNWSTECNAALRQNLSSYFKLKCANFARLPSNFLKNRMLVGAIRKYTQSLYLNNALCFGSGMLSSKSKLFELQPEVGGSGMYQSVPFCLGPRRSMFFSLFFFINFAVVFDFIYFRFLPSKAKWIGNVLTNR